MSRSHDPPLPVEPATGAAEVEAALELRARVFVAEQGIPLELERDGSDVGALHVLAWSGERPVATARLTEAAGGTGIVARVAVDPDFRGRGLGARVVLEIERLARERRLRRLVLHPHDDLETFYRDLGYRTVPGVSWAGEHRLITMEKRLRRGRARREPVMSLQMTRDEREAYLADVHVGIISIAEEGKGPLAVPIWYGYEPGGEVVIVTDRDSRKGRLLERSRRFSLCVQSEEPPYRYVSVEGPILGIEPADEEGDVRPLARRYLGSEGGDRYIETTRDTRSLAQSVKVRMRPERWLTVDYRKQLAAGG